MYTHLCSNPTRDEGICLFDTLNLEDMLCGVSQLKKAKHEVMELGVVYESPATQI